MKISRFTVYCVTVLMALKIGIYVPCAPDHEPTTKLCMASKWRLVLELLSELMENVSGVCSRDVEVLKYMLLNNILWMFVDTLGYVMLVTQS